MIRNWSDSQEYYRPLAFKTITNMSNIIKSNDWTLCVCFNEDGYVYCADKKHMSGYFFQDELEQLKKAIEKTLLMYKNDCITDEYIVLQDEEALKMEFERFNNLSRSHKVPKEDDLYLMHDVDANLLKIGRSVDAKKRLKQLQTANGHKLELLCVLKDQGDLEKEMQEKFVELNTNGEWYKYSDEIINEYIHLGGIILNKDSSTALFERCWIAYRRKGSKKKAFEYWCKLNDVERQNVLSHIKPYVSSRELQFQKDFERYLRDKIFTTVVFANNRVIYDPTKNNDATYMPICDGALSWSDYLNCYVYVGMFYGHVSDGYTDDNRPNGARIVLGNGGGYIIWDSETKKWDKI